MRHLLALSLLALPASAAVAAVADDSAYENIGMGGGGGIFASGASPVDPNFMLTSSDMSGCYRTEDAGRSWRMINSTQISGCIGCKPYFHPTRVDVVVWRDRISTDKARTWRPLSSGEAPWSRNGRVTHCAVHGDAVLAVYVGTAEGMWASHDSCATWQRVATGPCAGIRILPDGTAFAAVGDAVHRWEAGRGTPTRLEGKRPPRGVTALAAGGTGDAHTVHLACPSGVWTSSESGTGWRHSQQQRGVVDVVMAHNQRRFAYSCDRTKVFVTTDGGGTWTSTFDMRRNVDASWVQVESKWGYYVTRNGLNVCQGKGDLVLMSTQGDIYMSSDAGGHWRHLVNRRVGPAPGGSGGRYAGIGLEVTTTWDYCFDPWTPRRHYICYTDIGFAYSVDGGVTWSHGNRGSPWGNTWYGLAFDPHVQGRLYGACSSKHDIPQWSHANADYRPGGVVVSEDAGVSWRKSNTGLPSLPCCGVAVAPAESTPGKTTLYCTMYGKGVYKSSDSGATWQFKPGVGRPGNYHVYQVRIHPESGAVYVNVGGNRKGLVFSPNGGLWRSTDCGETWTEITGGLELGWPNGFAVHPENERIIYLAAGTYPGPGGRQGGVYRTADGGATWKHVLTNDGCGAYVHGMFVELHPHDPSVVYFGGTRGLFASPDGGATWRRISEIPFGNCHRARIDPRDKGTMYVTGFGGGVWRGPTVRGAPGEKRYAPAQRASQQGKPASAAPPKPAGPTDEQRAAAEEAGEALRAKIVDGVENGKRPVIYIDFMGGATRARILDADEDALHVSASGMRTSIRWTKVTPPRFLAIAKKYTEDRELLEAYRVGNGIAEE